MNVAVAVAVAVAGAGAGAGAWHRINRRPRTHLAT